MFIYFSCYFDIDQEHSSSKQIEKENKPRRKVIGLDNAIKNRFKWSKKGYEKSYILVWIGSGFWEPCGTPPPKSLESTPGGPVVDDAVQNFVLLISNKKNCTFMRVSSTNLKNNVKQTMNKERSEHNMHQNQVAVGGRPRCHMYYYSVRTPWLGLQTLLTRVMNFAYL